MNSHRFEPASKTRRSTNEERRSNDDDDDDDDDDEYSARTSSAAKLIHWWIRLKRSTLGSRHEVRHARLTPGLECARSWATWHRRSGERQLLQPWTCHSRTGDRVLQQTCGSDRSFRSSAPRDESAARGAPAHLGESLAHAVLLRDVTVTHAVNSQSVRLRCRDEKFPTEQMGLLLGLVVVRAPGSRSPSVDSGRLPSVRRVRRAHRRRVDRALQFRPLPRPRALDS